MRDIKLILRFLLVVAFLRSIQRDNSLDDVKDFSTLQQLLIRFGCEHSLNPGVGNPSACAYLILTRSRPPYTEAMFSVKKVTTEIIRPLHCEKAQRFSPCLGEKGVINHKLDNIYLNYYYIVKQSALGVNLHTFASVNLFIFIIDVDPLLSYLASLFSYSPFMCLHNYLNALLLWQGSFVNVRRETIFHVNHCGF